MPKADDYPICMKCGEQVQNSEALVEHNRVRHAPGKQPADPGLDLQKDILALTAELNDVVNENKQLKKEIAELKKKINAKQA